MHRTAATSGLATPDGTRRFAERFRDRAAPGHFRERHGLTFSSVGLGTYLGAPTPEVSAGYASAALAALEHGVNVFDTASNYRGGASERDLGAALERAFREGIASRDEVLLATKGGFLPFDGAEEDPAVWFEREILGRHLARHEDLAAGCHLMTPDYLQWSLRRSLQALRVSSIDVFFLHNPETQLEARDPDDFELQLLEAFEYLEEEANHGRFHWYGLATWGGFLAPPGAEGHLSLERCLELAQEAAERTGADAHRLGAIELPVNLAMPAAIHQPTQLWRGKHVPLLAAAREANLVVFGSASLVQGKLLGKLSPELRMRLGLETDAQRALQFARSAPGVTTALAGMSRAEHVKENLRVSTVSPLGLG